MAYRVGAVDRVGLPEQIVGEGDVAVRVGAGEVRQRRPRSRPHLVGSDPQDRGEVVVALPAFEQQLEHGFLIRRQRHMGKPRESGPPTPHLGPPLQRLAEG